MPYASDCILAGHMAPSGTQMSVYTRSGGAELHTVRIPTMLRPFDRDEQPYRCLTSTVTSLCHRYPGISEVGLAVAGTVSDDGNSITTAGALSQWAGFGLGDSIAEAAHLSRGRVTIGNSAVGRGLLETVNPDLGNEFFAAYFGDGVGGCWINRTVDGVEFSNPEHGHMRARTTGDEILCRCGKFNCLEVFASQYGVNRIIGSAQTRRLNREQILQLGTDISGVLTNVLSTRPVPQLVMGGLLTSSKYYPHLPGIVQSTLDRMMSGTGPAVVRSIVPSKGPTARAGLALALSNMATAA